MPCRMFTGLDHVTLVVRDLDQACTNYGHLLGRMPAWRGQHPALGTEAAIFALSNSAIELLAPKANAAESEGLREHLEAHGEGMLSLTFNVADAARAHQEFRVRGLRVAPPEDGEAESPDGTRRTFRTLEISPRATRGISVFGVERSELGVLRATTPPGPEAVEALDHVSIRTSNPDAVNDLYGKGFGIRLALDRTFGSLRILFFRTGGVTLEFVTDPNLGNEDKFYGLALRVRDIEAAHARLSGHGFNLNPVRAGTKPGTEVFSVRSETHNVPTLIIRDPARD
jgi:catechol 2,3-dioxygenase-like lactoylglutathione lyase family enzyme